MIKRFTYLHMKNFIPLTKFNLKLNSKLFSTIRLQTFDGTTTFQEAPRSNWELSKFWINPKNQPHWNSTSRNSSFANDENEKTKILPIGQVIRQIEFDRFLRKIGINISREDNVYVEDGKFKGKNVRLISSEKESAENISNLFEERGDFSHADVTVVYSGNMPEIGTKKFLFYDQKSKVIITNTSNLNSITKTIEHLSH